MNPSNKKLARHGCHGATFSWSPPAFLCLGILSFLIGGLQPVEALPTISVEPRNAAVLLGKEAQFTVTASGTAPLTYQWRFEGGELTGATNRNLTVTNVAPSDLGRYDAVVRDSAGAVTSEPAWLLLASRWTELVVFGASQERQTCGGFAWPDYLASRLGVRLRNYAEDGARNSQVLAQITRYLSSNKPTTNTLFAHWLGGSWIDFRLGRSPEWAASNRLASVRLLVNAGAKSLLLPTGLPPEMVPSWVANTPGFTSGKVIHFDTLMSEGLNELQAEFGVTIYRPDVFAWFVALGNNPSAYGFGERLGSSFTCDGAHFTTVVNRFVSDEAYLSLTQPVQIGKLVRTSAGEMEIRWSGGSPPFRIERTIDLLSGQWNSDGEPRWVNSATVKPSRPHEFFRVVYLGQ